jgi:hypothetical protein
MSDPALSNLLYATRRFAPPEDLTENANVDMTPPRTV